MRGRGALQAVEPDLRYYTSDAHVRAELKALHACVGLLAVEKDPQEVYAGMVDAAGILEDLAKAMLEGGLAQGREHKRCSSLRPICSS
jgi:hypothetical protein